MWLRSTTNEHNASLRNTQKAKEVSKILKIKKNTSGILVDHTWWLKGIIFAQVYMLFFG